MEHRTIITRYWTSNVVAAFFDRSIKTLIYWRREGLPHSVVPGNGKPIFLYEPAKVQTYAMEHRIRTYEKRAKAVHDQMVAAAETE